MLAMEGPSMGTDRYLKVILTIIALELCWLGLIQSAPAMSAQAAATPVIVTGIQLPPNNQAFLPVGIVGAYTNIPPGAAIALRPLSTRIEGMVTVREPITVEADRPLPVQQVDYTPRARPGD
jgi:hypothetical protein